MTVALTSKAEVSATPNYDALEPKQRAAVREFLVDFNQTRALTRAGYSKRTASQQGAQLFAKLKVRLAVDELMRVEAGVTRSRILEELARIAFADPIEIFDDAFGVRKLSEMTEGARAAIAGFKAGKYGDEIKLHDKVAALSVLARILGMLKDGQVVAVQNNNIQNNVNVGVMIAPQVATEEEWEARMREAGARDQEDIRKLVEAQIGA